MEINKKVKAMIIRDVKFNLIMLESKEGRIANQSDFDNIQRSVGENIAEQMNWSDEEGEEVVRLIVADFIN